MESGVGNPSSSLRGQENGVSHSCRIRDGVSGGVISHTVVEQEMELVGL